MEVPGSMAIGPYGRTSASCQPRPRSHLATAMCSLNTLPKPGLARMSWRSAAGVRFGPGVTLKVMPTVAALIVRSSVTQTNGGRALGLGLRERKEEVLGEERRPRDHDRIGRDRGMETGDTEYSFSTGRPGRPPRGGTGARTTRSSMRASSISSRRSKSFIRRENASVNGCTHVELVRELDHPQPERPRAHDFRGQQNQPLDN